MLKSWKTAKSIVEPIPAIIKRMRTVTPMVREIRLKDILSIKLGALPVISRRLYGTKRVLKKPPILKKLRVKVSCLWRFLINSGSAVL